MKTYNLIEADGRAIESVVPGTRGGHKRLKIYGRLDCPSALRYIAQGEYVAHRVFFADEQTAKSAGYRPCSRCMRDEYDEWRLSVNPQ
jgi:methylphosphotriester-DNA--protein-cysteine methyltransferase